MRTEYKIIPFENADNDFISVDDLKKFISDAEIILSDYESAWNKDFIKGVDEGHRGAQLRFNDGLTTWGYHIKSKLVKVS